MPELLLRRLVQPKQRIADSTPHQKQGLACTVSFRKRYFYSPYFFLDFMIVVLKCFLKNKYIKIIFLLFFKIYFGYKQIKTYSLSPVFLPVTSLNLFNMPVSIVLLYPLNCWPRIKTILRRMSNYCNIFKLSPAVFSYFMVITGH
jgi:hypothetical protein